MHTALKDPNRPETLSELEIARQRFLGLSGPNKLFECSEQWKRPTSTSRTISNQLLEQDWGLAGQLLV